MTKYSFLFATLVTIVMNTLAVVLPLNGVTTKFLSDSQKTLITPSGSTFIIWSVIFTGLLAISFGIIAGRVTLLSSQLKWYWLSTALNVSWLLCWHYQIPVIPAFLLFGLMLSNVLVGYKFIGWAKHLYLVYTSWTVVAATINIVILLQYNFGWTAPSNVEPAYIASFLLVVAITIFSLMGKVHRSIVPLGVGIWSLIGIYREQPNSVIQQSSVVLIIVAIILIVLQLLKMNTLDSTKLNH